MDNISEAAVQKAIDQVAKEGNSGSSPADTIRNADKIVVIEKGKIVEEGRHEELVGRKGRYWEMCTMKDE